MVAFKNVCAPPPTHFPHRVPFQLQVIERGLQGLVTFELVDYRDFAKQHPGEFDRIISCEMVREKLCRVCGRKERVDLWARPAVSCGWV